MHTVVALSLRIRTLTGHGPITLPLRHFVDDLTDIDDLTDAPQLRCIECDLLAMEQRVRSAGASCHTHFYGAPLMLNDDISDMSSLNRPQKNTNSNAEQHTSRHIGRGLQRTASTGEQ
jgi:hypothetical protein